MGSANGRWVNGRSPTYYRRIANAKPGEQVHHKDHNKSNNKYGNFIKFKDLGEHNKAHPEKLRKANKARGVKV